MKNSFKKSAVIVLAILWSTSLTFGQSFQKGDKLLNIGIGLGSQFVAAGGSGGIPPVGLSFESGISDNLSIGAQIGYASTSVGHIMGKWDYTYIIAAGRASYHFNVNIDKLDPYVGGLLGYNVASISTNIENIPTPTAGGIVYGAHAGARYLLSPKFGVFAEVGYGLALLNTGLAFKF